MKFLRGIMVQRIQYEKAGRKIHGKKNVVRDENAERLKVLGYMKRTECKEKHYRKYI